MRKYSGESNRMILLLDNYDSFTYNLAQYLGELGCDVEVHRNDKITVDEIVRRKPERIVISPGPCTPKEAGISVELVQRLTGKFPILGVCLGHQAIGAAFGGKIIRAPELFHGKSSSSITTQKVSSANSPTLSPPRATTPSSSTANLFRGEFTITAETDDGIIMGVRHRRAKLEGVQFHPESVLTTSGKQLLQNFLRGLSRLTFKIGTSLHLPIEREVVEEWGSRILVLVRVCIS